MKLSSRKQLLSLADDELKRLRKLAGITENDDYPDFEYSAWWAKANDELGLDFDDDIYSYVDLYDEPWQGEFAREVTNIDATDYEDFKSQVEDLYNELNPF